MSAPVRRVRSLLACFVGLALVLPAAAQREGTFMTEFRKLMVLNALDEMAGLIKKFETEAVLAVVETCEAIGEGSSDALEDDAAALDKAWRKAYGTRFVDKQYRYFSVELQPVYRKHRIELIGRYLAKYTEFETAQKAKDQVKFASLGLEFQGFGNAFGELGDHYMASQCYRIYAVCFDDGLNGSKADFKLACEGWGQFLKARELLELKDRSYDEAKVRFDKLEFDGFGDPAKGPEARGEAKAEADPAYKPVALGATFQLVPDIEAIPRPIYTGDANFQMWPAVSLLKIDSTTTFATMDDSPTIHRVGANKAMLDIDKDGKGEVDIPLTGKIMPVQIKLGSGETERTWAFLAAIGQQQDTYQGFRFNLGPDDNQMNLYVGPAASLVATLETVRVQVLDDNMDGIYGSQPKEWSYPGLIEGALQRDLDSIIVGEEKTARPWSRLQKIGTGWYALAPNETLTDVTATKADVESGTLQLDLKGVSANWMVLRGTGNANDLFYDVVNGGTNKVEVPVGSYELYVGQISEGKKTQQMKALVLPGNNSRSWKVGKGETTKVELGAPFTLEFSVTQDAETITVIGNSIVVQGRGGETYQRLWNCVLTPEVNLRKAGSSKGKKEAKLVPVMSQEEMDDPEFKEKIKDAYAAIWFPIGVALPKNQPGEDFEAQLFEKKHKLFGKLESDWKGK
jgi:hypothetical protein